MFGCCTTKEATTAVNIVKSTFQVFNIYVFGDTVAKKYYIIAAIMSIFIRTLIRDNETVAWFIMHHFISIHTVLTFIRWIIAYSDFCLATSVFSFVMSLSFAFEELRYTLRFRSDSFWFRS